MTILDVKKMSEATAQAVRTICEKQQEPCVGFCLLFCGVDDNGERVWGLNTQLLADAQNPLEEADRKALEKSMQTVLRYVKEVYEGEAGTISPTDIN